MDKSGLNINKILDKIQKHEITSEEGLKLIKELRKKTVKMSNTVVNSEANAVMYYCGEWKVAAQGDSAYPVPSNRCILAFGSGEEMQSALMSGQDEENPQVIMVVQGDEYKEAGEMTYVINPDNERDYVRLFEAIKSRKILPDTLLYMWPLLPGAEFSVKDYVAGKCSDSECIERLLSRGVYQIFYMIKAIHEVKMKCITRLFTVYNVQKQGYDPFMEAISGYSKSLTLAWPGLTFGTIEIQQQNLDTPELCRIVTQEINMSGRGYCNKARYDGKHRYIREIAPLKLKQRGEVKLREKGVYFITGGIGALGLIFARHLAKKCQSRLVLMGRSSLDKQRENAIKELQDLGSEVLYIKGDVGNAEDVRMAVEEAKGRFGNINGIIHAAGITTQDLVFKKDIQDFEAVLRPKVHGTIALDYATAGEPLDFFIMFSSTSAFLGDFGQCDYAVGNRFMDGFVGLREVLRARKERHGQTLSINWPLWKDGGMHLSNDGEYLYLQSSGMSFLETESGVETFDAILESGVSRVMVMAGIPKRIQEIFNNEPGIRNDESRRVERAKREVETQDIRLSRVKGLPVEQQVEDEVRRIAGDILKMDPKKLDISENIGNFGFDSISLKDFAERLGEVYQAEISPTIFFAHSSIKGIVGYLLDEFGTQIHKIYVEQDTELPPEGEEGNIAFVENNDLTGLEDLEPLVQRAGDFRLAVSPSKMASAVWVREPVAIIGISGVFPKSRDVNEFWKNLCEGRNMITEIPAERWDWREYFSTDRTDKDKINSKWGGFIDDVDKFDAQFYNISPREAELMDPQQRIFMETVWKAIEDSGYKASELSGRNIGVFVGMQFADYQELLRSRGEMQAQMETGNAQSLISNRVSFFHNFCGPSEAVDTACSSSLVAVHRAVKSIQMGECEMAVAGGVSILLSPLNFLATGKLGILSPDGKCKTFAKGANGYVKGEGVGALILKPLEKAIRDNDQIYAVIKGTAVNHGGRANTITSPNSEAQASLLIKAYEEAGFEPDTVTYLEAHGTGTELGDPIEVEGMKKAFREMYKRSGKPMPEEAYCGIGSVKTNIGHLEPASGIAGIIKLAMSMKKGELPGMLHIKELNPYIELEGTPFYVVKETMPWKRLKDKNGNEIPRRAGVSSFGFGGTNAHIVLEEYEKSDPKEQRQEQGPQLIVLSARNEERLREYAGIIAAFLEGMARPEGAYRKGIKGIAEYVQRDLIEMASRLLNITEADIEPDGEMGEYGFDPVTYSALAQQIGERYNIELDTSVFTEVCSIKQLAGYLCEVYEDLMVGCYSCVQTEGTLGTGSNTAVSLEEVAYTLQVGREEMEERIALVAEDVGNAVERLKLYSQGKADVDGLYSGNTKKSKPFSEIFLKEEEGKLFIRRIVEERDFNRIAKMWVLGAEIDWKLLYTGTVPARISMPGYPFARKSYWLPGLSLSRKPAGTALISKNSGGLVDTVQTADTMLSGRRESDGLIYVKEWRKVGTVIPAQAAFTGAYILLAGRLLTSEFIGGLKKAPGVNWIIVKDGNGYRSTGSNEYEFDFSVYSQGQRVVDDIVSKHAMINGLVDLTDIFAPEDDACRIEYGRIGVVQRLLKCKVNETLGIYHVTSGLQTFGSSRASLAGAWFIGFIKVLGSEYPSVQSRTLDIEPEDASPSRLLEILADASQANMQSVESCYRQGTRYIPRFRKLVAFGRRDKENRQGLEGLIHPGKVYVIAGGTSGIGMEIARHLASNGATRLALLGRTQLPEKASWQSAAESHPDKRIAGKLKAFLELERCGVSVSVFSGKLTDRVALEGFIDSVRKDAGAGGIGGFINSASFDFKDSPYFINKTEEDIRAVFEPKVLGTLIMAEILKNDPLDFFVMFSSVASAMPGTGVGMSHYAAANGFMDHFAWYKRASGFKCFKCINWVYWGETGNAVGKERQEKLERFGIMPVTNREGLECFDRIMESTHTQFVAGRLNPRILKDAGAGDGKVVLEYTGSPAKNTDGVLRRLEDYHASQVDSLEYLEQGYSLLNSYAGLLLLSVFRNMGVFKRSGESYSISELQSRLNIQDKYLRLLRAQLDILERNGFIMLKNGGVETTAAVETEETALRLSGLGEMNSAIREKYPDLSANVKLLDTCTGMYSEILTGRVPATDVMFPKGAMSLVEGLYSGSAIVDYFNSLIAVYIQLYLEERVKSLRTGEKINILEIGAGTGSSTGPVLEKVADFGSCITYCYTDISTGFLSYGRQKFSSKYPFVVYKVLNIEKDVEEQGFELSNYDIVVATNVIHATRDLSNTLLQVKKLLKKNGVFLLNELMALQDDTTLTFGLLDGWWRYNDEKIRIRNAPLLNAASWKKVSDEAGCGSVGLYGLPVSNSNGEYFQALLVCESDGFVEVDAGKGMEHNVECSSVPANIKTSAPTKPVAAVPDLKELLKSVLSEVLKIPLNEIEDGVSFGEYGVDSIVMGMLVKEMEDSLKITLNPSILIENDNLEKLSGSLLSTHGEAIRALWEQPSGQEISDMEEPVPEELPVEEHYAALDVQTATGQYNSHYVDSATFEEKQTVSVSIPEAVQKTSRSRKIAVVGMACNFPGAPNKETYWKNLAEGRNSVTEVPASRWDINRYYSPVYCKGKSMSKWGGFIEGLEYFDPTYFKMSDEDAMQMDPLARQFLEVSTQALRDAGYDRKDMWGKKVGVFAGARVSTFTDKIEDYIKNTIVGTAQNFVAAQVSHFFNFKGPSMVVDTACSSSLVSIHLGCQSLILGESETVLVGGSEVLLDERPYLILSEMRAFSPDGRCYVFDRRANGFVPGEGCGVVVLKLLDKAIEDGDRIYAVIDGSAVNNDGNTMGITTPNPEAQMQVIQEALDAGGIDPSTISYIEAHGTGTMIGDPIELKALTAVFRKSTQDRQFCGVGSVKTNIGHLLLASGIAGFIKVVMCISNRQIPASLNCEEPNPRFEFDKSPFYINRALKDWTPREGVWRAGISSFGLGGTNGHILVSNLDGQQFKDYKCRRNPLPPVMFNRKRLWADKKETGDCTYRQPENTDVKPGMLRLEKKR